MCNILCLCDVFYGDISLKRIGLLLYFCFIPSEDWLLCISVKNPDSFVFALSDLSVLGTDAGLLYNIEYPSETHHKLKSGKSGSAITPASIIQPFKTIRQGKQMLWTNEI